MNDKDFRDIEQFDVIEFQRDGDPEPRMAAVDKDGDNAVLVGYVHTDNKGYWHTVGPDDVIRVIKKYSDVPDNAALKEALRSTARSLENARGML